MFHWSFFFPDIPRFLLLLFLFFRGFRLAVHLGEVWWQQILLVFLHLKNVLTSPSFLKAIFSIWFWVNSSFSTWNCNATSVWLHDFWRDIHSHSNCFLPLGHLVGSAVTAFNSRSQGHEFEPMLGVEITKNK